MRKLDVFAAVFFLLVCFASFATLFQQLATVKTNVETIICDLNEC